MPGWQESHLSGKQYGILSKRHFPLTGVRALAGGLNGMTKDPDDLETGILHDLIGHLLRHGFNLGQTVFRSAFAAEGITPLQFMIMELVTHNPGISHSRLCRALGTSASVITTTLKPLMAAGRVTGSPMPGDARQAVYIATDTGRHAHERMQPLIARSELMLTEALSQSEQAELKRLLRLLIGSPGASDRVPDEGSELHLSP
ncbi:MAG: MarR family winged helix-turn-helix transcriptional regulator [Paracoccaceae bacterium]